MLGLLALAEVLGMSLWFSASAVSEQYRTLWSLTAAESGWLTTIVQLGFVAGTAGAAPSSRRVTFGRRCCGAS